MGKGIKIALAILYAVQVVVIFRESIDHLNSRGEEEHRGGLKQNQLQAQAPNDPRVLLKRAFQPIFKRQGLLAAAPLAGHAVTTVLTGIKRDEDHIHPPEEKPKSKATVRRQRHERIREYLVANLYPLLKKFRPPAFTDLTHLRFIAVDRALLFPVTE